MKKIICDTLVWYHVFRNEVVLDTENYDYYGTGANIADFLSSTKLFGDDKERESIKGAISAMHEHATDILFLDPLSSAALNLFRRSAPTQEFQQFENAYNGLVDYASNGDENFECRSQPAKQKLEKVRSDFSESTLDLRHQIDEYAHENELCRTQKADATLDFVTEWLILELNSLFDTPTDPIIIKPKLEQVNVFLKAYRRFIIRIDPTTPPNANHMIDLLQLLYIPLNTPYLFWTKDKSLKGKIIEEFTESEINGILYEI